MVVLETAIDESDVGEAVDVVKSEPAKSCVVGVAVSVLEVGKRPRVLEDTLVGVGVVNPMPELGSTED